MTQFETELTDHLLAQGWREGAASPERLANLLDRLSMRNKLMAAVALADTSEADIARFDDFEDIAA